MSGFNDTICAPSTPTGESAIAGIRLSGPLCKEIVEKSFGKSAQPRIACLGNYKDISQKTVDSVLYVYFKAPASYTGEDCLEIFSHGNPFIVQKLLDDLVKKGCRMADHGEFTRRAFLNKKLDLSQAQAVSLSISARSQAALTASQKQLAGELGKRINDYTDSLVNVCALVEAYIDFPEDNLPEEDKNRIVALIDDICLKLSNMVANSKYTKAVHNGINLAIIGEPNAGKSSLLNLLLGSERAIVSDIAGTTRDFISEKLNIGDYLFNITDTAGLRNSTDKIEKIGVERAKEAAKAADMILLVVDSSQKPDICEYKDLVGQNSTLLVLNKRDLPQNDEAMQLLDGVKRVEISCKDALHSAQTLRDAILAFVAEKYIVPQNDDILVSAKNAQNMEFAINSLGAAKKLILDDMPAELAASEIRNALENLGEIVGKVDCEEILDKIFSKFCIGK